MADNNSPLIQFVLKGVNTEQFAVIEAVYNETDPIAINVGFKMLRNVENRIIGTFIKIEFIQNDKPCIILENVCHFEILEESWNRIYDTETQIVKLPHGFCLHMLSTVLGVSRGYLLAKVEKIPAMRKIFVPLLDTTKLITGDIELKP